MEKQLNFAIVGKGFIYSRHKQAIEDLGHKVLMTCDIDVDKCADYTDWLVMFHSPEFKDVDCVSICCPNYLHSVIAREATLLGKKVLCEKPLTIFGDFDGLDKVSTVLQLRSNPRIKELKESLGENNEAQIVAHTFRDDHFWNSWKGSNVKAGVQSLHIIGVHYLDLLIHLLGDPIEVIPTKTSNEESTGMVRFEKGTATYSFKILPDREGQTRYLVINGEKVKLSDQDNLSYEDLHKEVYKDFIADNGIYLDESRKALELIEKII